MSLLRNISRIACHILIAVHQGFYSKNRHLPSLFFAGQQLNLPRQANQRFPMAGCLGQSSARSLA